MPIAVTSQEVTTEHICVHCGLCIPSKRKGDLRFCCAGCESVYKVLHELGLEQFYALRAQTGAEQILPPTPGESTYAYFDDPVFQSEHLQLRSDSQACTRLYLSGIHCAACVWVLEKLPNILTGIKQTRVSLNDSTLWVSFDPNHTSLSRIAQCIDSLGYKVRIAGGEAEDALRRQASKQLLLRIAVAAVAAGNCMMIAISLYQGWFTGIAQEHGLFLRYTSLLLSLPAVLYSAQPFYRASLSALKTKVIHIDVPISIGILGGFLLSALNTIAGSPHVYFDSITMLIFLLLLGRWLQRDGLTRVTKDQKLLYTLAAPQSFRRTLDGGWEEVYSGSLKPGDRILVPEDSAIPADGTLCSHLAHIDCSLLTGESTAQRHEQGAHVYAGTLNAGGPIEIEVAAAAHTSRIGKLMRELEESQSEKSELAGSTDAIAGYFVFCVLCISSFTAIYWLALGLPHEAIERTLAVLVVSCPCALGLAAPTSFAVAIRKAAQAGIFVKSANTLERLQHVSAIFFDKTGTITEGQPKVTSWQAIESKLTESQLRTLVASLEDHSSHPVGKALQQWAATPPEPTFGAVKEIEGFGVEQRSAPYYRLGSVRWCEKIHGNVEPLTKLLSDARFAQATVAVVFSETQVLAVFAIADQLRQDAAIACAELHALGYPIHIVSGDRIEVVEHISTQLDIPAISFQGDMSPEEKYLLIKEVEQNQHCVMVGDGANDGAALAEASVGVSLLGGAEISLRAADVYLSRKDLRAIPALVFGAQKTLSVIRRNLLFSVSYNILGVVGALMGIIGPLGAAILMPLSSITVVLSSLSLVRMNWTKHIKNRT